MVVAATGVLNNWSRILDNLVINPERALEELNSDWTASQELADVLMRKYRLPFRVGHHFASEVVEFAKAKDIKPLEFPYVEAQRIYSETVKGSDFAPTLPMSDEEFRATLNPIAIVKNRATAGGPQPVEMERMLKEASQKVTQQDAWIESHRRQIASSLARLDTDFEKLQSVR